MGPNIKPLPVATPLAEQIEGEVLLKVGDNITTDHIMPAGAKILALRSNIPAISMHCFISVDPTFPERALAAGGGILVGGLNYGQGSSREHAALAPLYLGIKAVLAKTFARIHMQNLVNFGLLPLVFADEADYDDIKQGDRLTIEDLRANLPTNTVQVRNARSGKTYPVKHTLSGRQIDILLAGGLLIQVGDGAKG